jgi:class 3 adenylate cyclase/tetratricopeptide (TPR) repeat protein
LAERERGLKLMACPNCGADNPPDKRFCGDCGTPLESGCPNCGAVNPPDKRFCGDCGTPLTASTALRQPGPASATQTAPAGTNPAAAPVSERRLVSVLFADLVGFTTLAEGRDAEETRELLTHYFDLARDVVGRYGGTIEKFIGDAVMAVWGAPVAREDDAERAVRAGLELAAAVPHLGPDIHARVGVLTGEAAVTIGATDQGIVAGDLVNTASRLQSVAEPGTVLVGETTVRAASRGIAFQRITDQMLKGKATPVPAWRALRVIAEIGGKNRTSEGLEAPFVGRDDELRLLKELFHATNRERRPRLISVVGPAGIGKSRLAWEFLKYVDGLVEGVWWHDGRSPAYGDGITFWALGEMVRARAGLLEADDEPTTRAKIRETVVEHVPDGQERGWIERALLSLLGFESGVESAELFAALRTFFERLALTSPVVMVFEDFHYADPGLIDFVDHLLEWSRNVAITVITLSRPELLDRRPDWGAGKRNFTSIYLEPLSQTAMHDLLSGLVPGLPEAALQLITARADGIPLYAVETVRALVAEGRVAEVEGVYQPVGELTELSVPETLTALIASRLDSLPPSERALVSDASVLGQSFSPQALAAVAGLPSGQVDGALHTLVRREIFRLEADPRSPERGQYAFVQALIREVAYNTLAKRDRKSRHVAAARYFEGLGSDELAGALASHYLAAQQNAGSGPEADALAAQARIALRAAAERAAALGSSEQAVTLLEAALGVTSAAEDTAELLERTGEMCSRAGHHEAAIGYLERALTFRREQDPNGPAVARVAATLGRTMITSRRMEDALALLQPIAEAQSDGPPDPGVINCLAQLARARMFTNHAREAIEIIDRALEAAERANLTDVIADALVTRGTALSQLGRLTEAVGVIEIGERLARQHGWTQTLLRALNNRAVTQDASDPAAVVEASREGLAIARRLGFRSWIFNFSTAVGFSGVALGQWDESAQVMGEALEEEPEGADRAGLLSNLAILRALRGEDVSAGVAELEALSAAQSDGAGPGYGTITTFALDTRGYVAFAIGDLPAARAAWLEEMKADPSLRATLLPVTARACLWSGDVETARRDLAELRGLQLHGRVVDAHLAAGEAAVLAADGRIAEALTAFAAVRAEWHAIGQVFELALVDLDMAVLMDRTQPGVADAAQEAREIFAGLGARPFLERLDATSGGPGASTSMPRPRATDTPRSAVNAPG